METAHGKDASKCPQGTGVRDPATRLNGQIALQHAGRPGTKENSFFPPMDEDGLPLALPAHKQGGPLVS